MKDEQLENQLIGLHSRGWSIRKLSQEFRVSRRRIRRIFREKEQERKHGKVELKQVIKRSSKLDNYKDYISELLEKYRDNPATAQRVFESIVERGYDGSISTVRNYLRKIRGKRIGEEIRCTETAPGELAAHDWSDYSVRFTKSGDWEKVTFFSYILSFSRRQHIEVVEDKTQVTLFRCLINAFMYLDGVPMKIRSDNQKACVDRWELGRVIFNSNFLNFATHYKFRPLTITPGKPRENLKVERPFYYLETNFFNARTFTDRNDLKQKLSVWLREKNDTRIHRTTKRRPIDLHSEELPYLNPLPNKHYDTSLIVYRTVNQESCVVHNTHNYYVPGKYMYENCPVRITENKIHIYSPDCKEIISYDLANKNSRGSYSGLPPKNTKRPQINVADLIERLNAFGPDMKKFIEAIKKDNPTNYPYHLRAILSLKINYYTDDIIIATRRALKFRVYKAGAIENFLKVNAICRNAQTILPQKNDQK